MSEIGDTELVAQIRAHLATGIARLRHTYGDASIDAARARQFAEDLQTELLERQTEPRLQQLVIRTVAQGLDDAAESFGLPFPRRRLHQPPRPPAPLRRQGWQKDAAFAFACWDRLHHHFDRRGKGLRDDGLAGLILASAILRGLLLRPEAWPALLAELARGGPQLQGSPALPDLPWIELDLPLPPGRPTNHGQATERLRVFPDVVTLALLKQWQREAHRLRHLPGSPAQAMVLMTASLFETAPACPSPECFAAAAMAPWEDEMAIPLPFALTAVSSGQITGFSAGDAAWQGLLGAHPADCEAEVTPSRRKIVAPAPDDIPAGATPAGSLAALQQALQVLPEGAQKQTRKPVERALDALPRTELTPAAHALRIWYLHLLQSRRTVSTLHRYHGAIARTFLGLCGRQDPRQGSPDDLEDLVEMMLSHPGGIETPYAIGRLVQFCHFAAANPALRWPAIDPGIAVGTGEGRRPRIRTALVSARQIAHALRHWPADDPELRETDCTALLLAVRGGLRLSELEALTVGDVMPGRDGTILVHATLWANIKSTAGRRRLPVQLLTSGDEAQQLERFFIRRLREASNPREQLLSTGTELFGRTRFDRKGFATRLRAVLGLSPHDLRHAALSNLALLLITRGVQPKRLQDLTGWPTAQQNRIRDRLLGSRPDPREVLTRLARLAGHARPETTIRSYLHLGDLALGLILRSNPEAHSAARAARWLRLNRRSLTPSKHDELVVLESARPAVLAHLAVQTLAVPKATASRPVRPALPPRLTPDLAHRLLTALARGTPSGDLAERFALSRTQIRRLETTARNLMPGRLAPVLPRHHDDRNLARNLMRHLAKLDPADARAWSLQTLRAARSSDLCFATRRQFETWLKAGGPALATIDWQLTTPANRLRARPRPPHEVRNLPLTALTTPAILTICAMATEDT